MAKYNYGEFNCAQLKPTWDVPKPRGDKNGYVRGAVGVDGLLDADGDEFMKTFDPKADQSKITKTTARRPAAIAELINDLCQGPGWPP
jgi:hypothetical protein